MSTPSEPALTLTDHSIRLNSLVTSDHEFSCSKGLPVSQSFVFCWCGKYCPRLYEHYLTQAEGKPIAEHVLHKIESRLKLRAQHPRDVGNCHHDVL